MALRLTILQSQGVGESTTTRKEHVGVKTQPMFDESDGTISAEVYSSESIYQDELERVFRKTWLFLGHTSQFPKPGSFVSTYMAEDPVILVKQADGSFRAFLNQCRHRGMRVCTADEGVTKNFTCVYHGWTYAASGELVSVPHIEDAYKNDLDRSKFGLNRVPLVEEYKGLIFGNWDADAESLDDYLGDMKWYIDSFIDRWDGGMEVIPGVHKWVIRCNWKFPAEQFSGDMYHSESTHVSALMALADPASSPDEVDPYKSMDGFQFSSPKGHGHGFTIERYEDFGGPITDEYRKAGMDYAESHLGPQRAHMRGHANVFPNFSFLSGYHTIRVWHPRGPHEIEVWAWGLIPKEAPPEVKDAYRKSILRTFSPAGFIEQDDGVNLVEIQRILQGSRAQQTRFNVAMGLGHEVRKTPGFDGPGAVHNSMFAEIAARGFYKRWQTLMDSPSPTDAAEATS